MRLYPGVNDNRNGSLEEPGVSVAEDRGYDNRSRTSVSLVLVSRIILGSGMSSSQGRARYVCLLGFRELLSAGSCL